MGGVRGALGLIGFAVAVLLAVGSVPAAAHGEPDETLPHALQLTIAFPDAGLAGGELLCFALFAGHEGDFSSPAQSHCLPAGAADLRFDGLTHGPYTLVVLAAGSVIGGNRYQGQVIATDLPDEPGRAEYAVPISLQLAPEVAGATGRVQVSVFGCPPGTDAGGDATGWLNECDLLANDVPVSLSGIGSIDDTADQAVTGQDTALPGRAQFSDLPAGDYQIEETLPAEAPPAAAFVESSIDGTVAPLSPDETLALRPTEVKSVAYFVVLPPDDAEPEADASLSGGSTGGDPAIDGAPAIFPTPAPTDPPPPAPTDPVATDGLPGPTNTDGPPDPVPLPTPTA